MFPRAAEKMSRCWYALAFAVFTSFYSPAAAAPKYFTRTWQVEQGLPQNKVTAVVQTPGHRGQVVEADGDVALGQ